MGLVMSCWGAHSNVENEKTTVGVQTDLHLENSSPFLPVLPINEEQYTEVSRYTIQPLQNNIQLTFTGGSIRAVGIECLHNSHGEAFHSIVGISDDVRNVRPPTNSRRR